MIEFDVWAVDVTDDLYQEDDVITIYYQRVAGIPYWGNHLPRSGANQPQNAPEVPKVWNCLAAPYKVKVRYSPEVLERVN